MPPKFVVTINFRQIVSGKIKFCTFENEYRHVHTMEIQQNADCERLKKNPGKFH